MADNENIIKCPACGTEMKKVFIPEANMNLDICLDGCGGIYFDNRELEKVDEQHESIDSIIEIMKNKTYKYVDSTEKRICPVCATPMVKHFMSVKKEVEIDDCYACGGKFLDFGELEKIRSQYKTTEERKQAVVNYFNTTFAEEFQKEGIEKNTTHKRILGLSKFIEKFI